MARAALVLLMSLIAAGCNNIAAHDVIPVPLKPDQMLHAIMAGQVNA